LFEGTEVVGGIVGNFVGADVVGLFEGREVVGGIVGEFVGEDVRRTRRYSV
jgi:hypothetical protein